MALGGIPTIFSVTCKWVTPVPSWSSPSFFSHYFSFLWVGVHNSPFCRNTSHIRLLLSHVQICDLMYCSTLPSPSPVSGVCSNSCPLSRWCHPTISSSANPFSSCPQSFPASGSFPVNWLFISGGQSIGTSASASVLPMNIPHWFPWGLTGWISLQSKGFSRVFSDTTVQY